MSFHRAFILRPCVHFTFAVRFDAAPTSSGRLLWRDGAQLCRHSTTNRRICHNGERKQSYGTQCSSDNGRTGREEITQLRSYTIQELVAAPQASDAVHQQSDHGLARHRSSNTSKAIDTGHRPNRDEQLDKTMNLQKAKVALVDNVRDLKLRTRRRWEEKYSDLISGCADVSTSVQELFSADVAFARSFAPDFDVHTFRQRFFALKSREQLEILPSLLIGSFVDTAERSLFVLANLATVINFRMRMQCLRHLYYTYDQEIRLSPHLSRMFQAQIALCRPREAWSEGNLSKRFLEMLLKWSNPEECETVIRNYVETYPFAKPEDLFPIIEHYISKDNVDEALRFFARLPEQMIVHPTDEVISLRNQILKRDTVVKTETGSNFKALPVLLALGTQPDAVLHNIVVGRAISQGLPNVAWDMYHYLKSEGLEIAETTYLDLLRDSFVRGHTQGVNDILTAIHQRPSLLKNRFLIAYSMNIVRVISRAQHDRNPVAAFERIMALYDRAWTRQPLERFGILDQICAAAGNQVMEQPSPVSVAYTLWSYLLVQQSTRIGDFLWRRIVRLADQGDEVVLDMLKHDILYNGFVLFYARKLGTLTQALQVLQHMLDKGLCAPSARTWSLLTCAFLRHHQTEQAMSVIRLMTAKGYKIEVIDEKYIPSQYSLQELSGRVDSELDEKSMPEGLEFLLSD